MTHPDLHSLTGAYALDALDDAEREAFEAHLPGCPECQDEVEGFLATAAMLGGAVAEPPPAHLKGAVLDAVARTRQDPPRTDDRAPRRRDATVTDLSRRPTARGWRDRLLLPAAAVLAVVVAGMAIMIGNLNQRLDRMVSADEVASVVAAADLQTWEAEMPDGGTARVVYSATRGEGWFLADGMAATGEGEVYELWLIDEDGPAPAGLFHTADGLAAHAFTGDIANVQNIGVTVEPSTGSLEPTSDPVVVFEL